MVPSHTIKIESNALINLCLKCFLGSQIEDIMHTLAQRQLMTLNNQHIL